MDQSITLSLMSLLPAILVALISYFFFKSYIKNEENRRKFVLHRENQKTALPQKLQAYERLTLFLERITPGALLTRIKPYSDDKNAYEELLIKTIMQEYEHNLSQQIYVTERCWNVVRAAKNATISIIRKTSMGTENSDELRETILRDLLEKIPPSETGLSYIKQEIADVI